MLVYAIPDHPWVDSSDGAAVRISMTVGAIGSGAGLLQEVQSEVAGAEGEISVVLGRRFGVVHGNLRIGVNLTAAKPLLACSRISSPGVKLHGSGFIVSEAEARAFGLETSSGIDKYIKPYRNGRDLADRPRRARVIDFYGLDQIEILNRFPGVYQHLLGRVKPGRDATAHTADGAGYARLWWLHGKPRPELRRALNGLGRFIATPVTAKFRLFQFLDASILPDDALIAIGSDAPLHLGILTSQPHVSWAIANGSTLEDRPRYIKTRCFETFPFPETSQTIKCSISFLAERLDGHRKSQQSVYPDLTLTGMYNVLEKLRSGEPLTAKERILHEEGLVSVLRQLHDDLDAAVLEAYGWSDLISLLRVAHGNDSPAAGQTRDDAKRAFDEAILERLMALNAERAAEEARGLVRWLRPEFQNQQAVRARDDQAPEQTRLETVSEAEANDDERPLPGVAAKPVPWPKEPIAQVRAVADLLAASPVALSLEDIAARFTSRGPWKKRLPGLLEMLVTLGRASMQGDQYTGTN